MTPNEILTKLNFTNKEKEAFVACLRIVKIEQMSGDKNAEEKIKTVISNATKENTNNEIS